MYYHLIGNQKQISTLTLIMIQVDVLQCVDVSPMSYQNFLSNDADRIENSADPDQPAPASALFVLWAAARKLCVIGSNLKLSNFSSIRESFFKPHHKKTCFLHMQKQRCRSDTR